MTALFIVLGILALIALLLFSFATLTVDYNQKLTITAGFLCFHFPIGQKPRKKKAKGKGKKGAKKAKKEPTALEKKFKAKSFKEKVSFVIEILREVMPQIKYLLSRVRVREFETELRIGTPDAAKTAIEYGSVCSAVYPFLSWAQGYVDISVKRVDITAAFGEEKCSARLHLKLKLRVITLIIAVFKLLPIYQKLTEDSNNERKKHRFHN